MTCTPGALTVIARVLIGRPVDSTPACALGRFPRTATGAATLRGTVAHPRRAAVARASRATAATPNRSLHRLRRDTTFSPPAWTVGRGPVRSRGAGRYVLSTGQQDC